MGFAHGLPQASSVCGAKPSFSSFNRPACLSTSEAPRVHQIRWQRANAHIDPAAANTQRDPSVLRHCFSAIFRRAITLIREISKDANCGAVEQLHA